MTGQTGIGFVNSAALRTRVRREADPWECGVARNRAGADFAATVALLLRASRRRQRLSQAGVAARTGGVVSKAAVANYETGHRSLRIEVFWALVRALGEDPGALLAQAERYSRTVAGTDRTDPVTIDVAELLASADARLAPVQRWLALRAPRNAEQNLQPGKLTLHDGALAALATLMGMETAEASRLLSDPQDAQSRKQRARCGDDR